MPGYSDTRKPRAYIGCSQVPVTLLRINSKDDSNRWNGLFTRGVLVYNMSTNTVTKSWFSRFTG
jgi:hypothetical protein